MKKLVSESLQEYNSLNESIAGIILTGAGLYFIYKFFKSLLQTPQQ
jgi:putative Mn2+ efflux pump MntP